MPDNSNQPTGLMGVDPELVMNLGLGLMSAGRYGGNLGDALSGAYQNYQLGQLRKQQLGMGQLEYTRQRMLLGAAAQEFAGQQGQPQTPAQATPQPQGPPLASTNPQGANMPFQAQSPFQPPTPDQIYAQSVGGISPGYLRGSALLSGRSPLPDLNSLREQQLKMAQQQYAPVVQRLANVAQSDSPTRDVGADPQLQQLWQSEARLRGVDPTRGFTDQTVRQVFSAAANNYRSALQLPTVAPPAIYDSVSGPMGYRGQVNRETGQETQVQGREMPVKVGERWNPDTQQTEAVYQQFAPSGPAAAPQAAGARRPGVGSTPAGRTPGGSGQTVIPMGYGAPNAENNKAAMFAGEFRNGNQTLNKLEKSGFQLSPTARAIAISMATDESATPMSQLLQQELAAHALSKNDQGYLAAMMPMLQAAGHDQSGARLSTAQIRQNLESLLPMGENNKLNMDQVHANRQGFYVGLLTQAGSAIRLPAYKNSLLADWNQAQQEGTQPLKLYGWGKEAQAAMAPGESRTIGGVKITRMDGNSRVGVINRNGGG
jgi:hypothetical protein